MPCRRFLLSRQVFSRPAPGEKPAGLRRSDSFGDPSTSPAWRVHRRESRQECRTRESSGDEEKPRLEAWVMVPVERIELPTFGLQNRCAVAAPESFQGLARFAEKARWRCRALECSRSEPVASPPLPIWRMIFSLAFWDKWRPLTPSQKSVEARVCTAKPVWRHPSGGLWV